MFAVEGRGEVSEWNFSECIPSVFYIAPGIANRNRDVFYIASGIFAVGNASSRGAGAGVECVGGLVVWGGERKRWGVVGSVHVLRCVGELMKSNKFCGCHPAIGLSLSATCIPLRGLS